MCSLTIYLPHSITKYRRSCEVSEVSGGIGLSSLVIVIKLMVTIKYNMTEFATYLTLWLIHVITTKILEMRL